MGKWMVVLIAPGLMGALCLAQNPPPSAGDKPATVEGTVTNALTGEPLMHAHVRLSGFGGGERRNFGAITTVEGKFSIANIPAGSYTASAERVGFTFTADRAGRFGTQIEVRAGNQKTDLKLKLTPTGAISGRVVGEDGEPVEGVNVSAAFGPAEMGQSAITDDKGQFRIGSLPRGKYRVRAMPVKMFLPPEIRTDGTVEVNYAQTYYPNSRTEKGAGWVEVQAGAEIGGIGIQLIRAPIVGVSGIVAGMSRGAERMMIELRQGRSARGGGVVKEDGTFQIWRLDPGKYTITATLNANGQRMGTAPVDIEVAEANIEHVELRIVPPSDIAGQVEFEDEQAKQPPQPPQGRTQTTQQATQQTTPPKPPPLRLSIVEMRGGPSSQPSVIGEDGSFRLEGLAPARYHLIPSWGGVYVKSMRLGQTSIDGNLLDLSNGAAGASLSVLISSATGEISGIVSDDKGPAAGVRVALLLADDDGFPFPRLVATGEDGSYRLTGIAPGKYKLTAGGESDFQTLQAMEPDDDAPLELVEIHAGDKLTKDLKQRPPS